VWLPFADLRILAEQCELLVKLVQNTVSRRQTITGDIVPKFRPDRRSLPRYGEGAAVALVLCLARTTTAFYILNVERLIFAATDL
jgi:hypothetical protein